MLWRNNNYWTNSNSKRRDSLGLDLVFFVCLLAQYFLCNFAIPPATAQTTQTVNLVDSNVAHSLINQDFYRAAVVEYAGDEDTGNLTPDEIILKNTQNFEKIIADAANHKTDIIVFPEYGLTTLRFSFRGKRDESIKSLREQIKPFLQYIPEVGHNPCTAVAPGGLPIFNETRSEVIERLSCASRTNKIYTLINLGEISPCTTETVECPPTGVFHYNTAVVFDRDGQIVAKYRKINLFAEPQFDVPEIPELSTFSTDFGVDFGVFICFDLLFSFPAKHLVSKGIKHFLFPTAWIDELPFLTAIQAQMFWSSSSTSTVLAAGYHQPQYGKLGSGIFSPSGAALNYTFDPDSGTQVIYALVPSSSSTQASSHPTMTESSVGKSPPEKSSGEQDRDSFDKKKNDGGGVESLDEYHFYYRENLDNYTASLIPLIGDGEDNTVLACDGNFCCELNYSFSSIKPEANDVVPPPSSIVFSSSNDCAQNDMKSNFNSSSLNYKLIVFNQIRKFSSPSVVKTMHLQICSVVRCLNESLQSCAEDSRGDEHDLLPGFQHFNLRAEPFALFDENVNSSQPTFTTLDTEFNLIPVNLFNLTYSDDKKNLTLISDKIDRFFVQTIALFNRVY